MSCLPIHPQRGIRRAARAGVRVATVAAAAALLALPAAAGRAQAGGGIGLYSNHDLLSGATTGQALRNGAVVQNFSVSGDPSAVDIPFFDAEVSAAVRLDSAGVLSGPDGTGLPFGGHKAAEANRATGVLRLGGSSTYAAYDVNGRHREGFVTSGSIGAEVFESFELRYEPGRLAPITVQLRFTIDGAMAGNQGDNGYVNGVQLYAILGNTDQAAGQLPGQSPVWRSETSLNGEVLDVTGTVFSGNCSAAAAYCETFVTLYVGMDFRSRIVASGAITTGGPTGAPFDADFTARMALTTSPGVTVLQYDNRGNYEALHSWVNPSAPVPEPGSWALLLAGLAGVGVLARRRPSDAAALRASP